MVRSKITVKSPVLATFQCLPFHINYSYAYCSLPELHSLIVFVREQDKLGFKGALGFFLLTHPLAVMNGSNASCI